jgi:hypothetical protein
MMRGDSLSIVYLLMALVLPVSALLGHKLAWKKGLLMALAWAGIFVIVAAVISTVKGP